MSSILSRRRDRTISRKYRPNRVGTNSGLCISTLLSGPNPTQLYTTSGHILQRQPIIESIVQLHYHLAEIYGISLTHEVVTEGVNSMLQNPSFGHIILAWRPCDNRVMGQLEVKRLFEVLYNAEYWYIDNHTVFPDDQNKSVGSALLDYARTEAVNKGVDRLRLYVGHMNANAKTFYMNYGFRSLGELLEFSVL